VLAPAYRKAKPHGAGGARHGRDAATATDTADDGTELCSSGAGAAAPRRRRARRAESGERSRRARSHYSGSLQYIDSIMTSPDDNDSVGSDFEAEEYEYDYDSASDDDLSLEGGGEVVLAPSLFNQKPVPCPICREDRVEEGCAVTLPGCSHSFCIVCFATYVEAATGNGDADDITCPFIFENGGAGRRCCAPVGPDVLREIMTQESYERWQRLKDDAFARKNPDYHHCPTPDCTNIVLCRYVDADDGNETKSEEGGVASGRARICDCFQCEKTSCLTCGATPFHTNRTCEEYGKEKRRKEGMERERLAARLAVQAIGDAPMPSFRIDRPAPDRSRANEEAKYEFAVETGVEVGGDALASAKRCRRCGNGVALASGCLKMKCLCGYRFCYRCGSENAQCDCTPAHHGFADNHTGGADFSGLREAKSYT
ncbi:hypothetical protein ACHAWF_011874, partial [Thalassiosira exigua]